MNQAAQKKQSDLKQLPLHGFKHAEHEQAHIIVTITDLHTTPEDVCRPEFWANHGNTLKRCLKDHAFPKIEVLWSDGSKHMELLCIKADNLYANVLVKSLTKLKKPADFFEQVDYSDEDEPNIEALEKKEIKDDKNAPLLDANDPDNYVALWIGSKKRFGVQRKSDKEYLVDGLDSKDAAEGWLKQYLAAM